MRAKSSKAKTSLDLKVNNLIFKINVQYKRKIKGL